MDRGDLNRMFDALSPAPEREEELLDGLLQRTDRRRHSMKSWKRMAVGLAAAVLLVGTAAAAHYVGVSIREQEDGFLMFGGGMTFYGEDQLSDEAAAMKQIKPFESWQEMEDFLGLDLMNSPLLDEFPAARFRIQHTFQNGRSVSGRVLLLRNSEAVFTAQGCYEIDGCNIIVDAYLFTDKARLDGSPDHEFFGVGGFPEGTETAWEPCSTPGGRQVQVVEIDRPDADSSDTCIGAISLNGIPKIVRVNSREGVAEARQVLMQVLDSFQ